MATCCSITFVVFSFMVMAASIASVNLPLFIIVGDGSFDGSGSEGRVGAGGSAIGHHFTRMLGHESTQATGSTVEQDSFRAKRKTFNEQNLPLPEGSFQCPFFDHACAGTNQNSDEVDFPFTTDELLDSCGCADKIGSSGDGRYPRLWSIVASPVSGVTFSLGIAHMIRSSRAGSKSGVLKASVTAAALLHVAVTTASIYLQSRITPCVSDCPVMQVVFGGKTIIMVSMIVESFASAVMFFCAIGMACSWCCACCGAPAGNAAAYPQNNVQVQMINYDNTYPASPYANLPPPAQNPAYGQPQNYPSATAQQQPYKQVY